MIHLQGHKHVSVMSESAAKALLRVSVAAFRVFTRAGVSIAVSSAFQFAKNTFLPGEKTKASTAGWQYYFCIKDSDLIKFVKAAC